MTRALILAAVSTIGIATPVLAQQAVPASAAAAPPQAAAPDPSCPPEHAAMGHCTPKPAATPSSPVPPSATDPHAGQRVSAPAPAAPAPAAVVTDPACPPEHAQMGHCTPKAGAPAAPARATPPAAAAPVVADPACPPEHAAMGHCKPAAAATPTDAAPAGPTTANAAAPGVPPVAPPPPAAFGGPENAADTVWDPTLMAQKRAEELISEHGGYTGYQVLFDRFEYRAQEGSDGYAWEGDAWYGGDYNRVWLKTEGEGEFGGALESAEVQALYSRALDPWFNLQAGVRYDIRPKPDRTYLAVGIQGLAPYWFEVDGAFFLSDKGDVTARLEAEYDQRITNRLILQPRIEFDLAAQDVPELGIGAGLSSIEAGLRLRYEIKREFAPYVGVEYERRFGDTADFARADGHDAGGWAMVVGLRSWF